MRQYQFQLLTYRRCRCHGIAECGRQR